MSVLLQIYGRFMLGDGVPLLSSAAMHSMLTPTVSVSGAQNGSHSCGLSWFLRGGEAGEGCANVFFCAVFMLKS